MRNMPGGFLPWQDKIQQGHLAERLGPPGYGLDYHHAMRERLFTRSRKRCARTVLSGTWEEEPSPVPMALQEPYWRGVFQQPSITDHRTPPPKGPKQWSLVAAITVGDVTRAFKGMSDGAPGPDGRSLNDLKGMSSEEVAAHFNLWLLAGYPPASLRRAETVLIAKEAGVPSPDKHRPITISDVILRCFHKILASPFEATLPRNTRQKVFMKGDGVADSIWLLQTIIRVRAGAAAAALTDDIQEEGAATDTGLLSICPECSRAFGSGRGLSQHRRRAHPSEYHAENVPVARMKARWDHEELLILARTENVFRRSGVRNINQRLVQITPGRTLDSIKGVRKSKRYQELLASLQREADSSELIERIPAPRLGGPECYPRFAHSGRPPGSRCGLGGGG